MALSHRGPLQLCKDPMLTGSLQALIEDGMFCGLPLDQDNESEKTEDRVKAWAAQLKKEGMPA